MLKILFLLNVDVSNNGFWENSEGAFKCLLNSLGMLKIEQICLISYGGDHIHVSMRKPTCTDTYKFEEDTEIYINNLVLGLPPTTPECNRKLLGIIKTYTDFITFASDPNLNVSNLHGDMKVSNFTTVDSMAQALFFPDLVEASLYKELRTQIDYSDYQNSELQKQHECGIYEIDQSPSMVLQSAIVEDLAHIHRCPNLMYLWKFYRSDLKFKEIDMMPEYAWPRICNLDWLPQIGSEVPVTERYMAAQKPSETVFVNPKVRPLKLSNMVRGSAPVYSEMHHVLNYLESLHIIKASDLEPGQRFIPTNLDPKELWEFILYLSEEPTHIMKPKMATWMAQHAKLIQTLKPFAEAYLELSED